MDGSVTASAAPVRYAVRQVLDQELQREKLLQNSMARQARSSALMPTLDDPDDDKEHDPRLQKKLNGEQGVKAAPVKRDFFGRIINEARSVSAGKASRQERKEEQQDEGRVWVSFHEGFSNAVRKPITL